MKKFNWNIKPEKPTYFYEAGIGETFTMQTNKDIIKQSLNPFNQVLLELMEHAENQGEKTKDEWGRIEGAYL
jgi:hypothetical protein